MPSARAVRPAAPGARRPRRARPRAGSSAAPTSCTRTACGRARRGGRSPSGAATSRRRRRLHNAVARRRPSTGAVYAALERVVARRSALVLGVSADLVDAACGGSGPVRTGLAVVAAPAAAGPRRVTGTPCAPTSGSAAAPRSPSPWPGSPRRRASTCCSTPRRELDGETRRPGSPSWPATARCGRRCRPRIDAERCRCGCSVTATDVPDLLRGRRRRRVERGVGGPAGRHPGGPARGGRRRRHRRRRDRCRRRRRRAARAAGDPVSLSRAIRDVVLARGGARRPAVPRRRARAAELPTEADALEAALTAYRSVLPTRPRPEHAVRRWDRRVGSRSVGRARDDVSLKPVVVRRRNRSS